MEKMKCKFCGQPATVHYTKVGTDGQPVELHLCAACEEKQQLGKGQELNLSTILQALIGANVGGLSHELSRLQCPACGMKYMDFRAEGRLGCPHEYNVFRKGLLPLLERIHRAEQHQGKRPRHHVGGAERAWEVIRLRRQLHEAIAAEGFERAAQLRDQIRQKDPHG
jgi:protein arginine kinase activator